MKLLFIILICAATVAQADTYKWTDKNGTVHFSEFLGEVPVDYQHSVQPLGVDTNVTTNKNKAVSGAESRPSVDAPKLEELKERMLNDDGTMALIRKMQNDPEMQALLSNPEILRAIQAMDIGTLMNNPDFMKLLNNPRVQEIEKRMQGGK